MNLFEYIDWRCDIPFSQVPFNKIDALLLAQISYTIFDGTIGEDFSEQKTFLQVAEDFIMTPDYNERINIGFLINDQTSELMIKCAHSERFKNVIVCGYKNIFSEDNVEQFAAMTFLIDKKAVIVFRGTDDTIVGWKEDFNIAWMEQIPAQKDAIEYFEAAAKYFDCNLIIAGHSKGGNLALYTGTLCDKTLQDRIEMVYNFDGPGFSEAFFKTPEYKKIEKRVLSVYPKFSVVGMIFHHPKKFIITDSEGFTFWQHDAMNWHIKGGEFIPAAKFTDESRLFHKAFNQWIDKLNTKQKKSFVETMFCVLEASGAKTNNEIEKNALQATARMLAAYAELPKQKRTELKNILAMFKDVIADDIPIFKPLTLQKNNLRINV